MVSTIYSVVIHYIDDEDMEVRCSFMNSKNAFSFAREIVNNWIKMCESCEFFIEDSDGFVVYDEYRVPVCAVYIEANDLIA